MSESVLLIGGPLAGEAREVEGTPHRLYLPASPLPISSADLKERPPSTHPGVVLRYIYDRIGPGSYEYVGYSA